MTQGRNGDEGRNCEPVGDGSARLCIGGALGTTIHNSVFRYVWHYLYTLREGQDALLSRPTYSRRDLVEQWRKVFGRRNVKSHVSGSSA
jgi:hypothetical protein